MSLKGGVYLKQSTKTHWAGVLFMARNGILKVLSCDTESSFVFVLTVKEDVRDRDLPFLEIKTNAPLRSVVLKFNILGTNCDLVSTNCNGKQSRKKCVPASLLELESNAQQYLYLNTVASGEAICLAIMYAGQLSNADTLLEDLMQVGQSDSAMQSLIYLSDYMKEYKLGLVVMEFADSSTYFTFSSLDKGSRLLYAPHIGAAMLKAAQLGIFNTDMHNKNVLLTKDYKVKLIDFGRCVHLSNLPNKLYSIVAKRALPINIKKLIFDMKSPKFYESVSNVVKAFALLADLDLYQNNLMFGGMHQQMGSFLKCIFKFDGSEKDDAVLYNLPYNRDVVLQCMAEFQKFNRQTLVLDRSRVFEVSSLGSRKTRSNNLVRVKPPIVVVPAKSHDGFSLNMSYRAMVR
jgi:hypothetical protein